MKQYVKKTTAFLLSWLLIALTLAGCGSKTAAESPSSSGSAFTKVTLNEVAHSIFYAPMYVAIEEGYFKDAGIDLTLVTGFGVI